MSLVSTTLGPLFKSVLPCLCSCRLSPITPGMSPNTLKDYEMTENAKESANCEAAAVAAGAEAMEVATEGEAATVAAGASGDATYGSHLPY